jgi:polysaccharide biosynthesis protein PslJ
MSSSVAQRPPATARGAPRALDTHPAPATVAEADNWPHTNRPLPWLLAGFLVMIFLVPFDSIIFKVHMPANATFDRVFLVLMIAVFVASRAVHGRSGIRRRLTPVEIAMLVFGGISLLSIVLNIDRIYQQNQLSFVEKGFSQLLAFGAFFFVVIATVRGDEVPAYARLVTALACITAVGVIYEGRTGTNLFFTWFATLLRPVAAVGNPPMDGTGALISGPTQHPLALASMLTIALPFAVMPLLEPRRPIERLKYLLAIGLILGADFSTNEKTAFFAPIAAIIVLAAYNRRILRWMPIAIIVLIPVIHVASPGALGNINSILPWSSSGRGGSDFTDGRSDDYAAVAPDILNNLIIGRGSGTLDTSNWRTYRILDNNYLDTLFQVGIVGLISFLAIVFCAIMTSHGVIKRGGVRGPPALAAAAGCAAFGVVSATYDASGFPQAVYSFLFVAGLAAVVASKPTQAQPAPAIGMRVGRHSCERGSAEMRRALTPAGNG